MRTAEAPELDRPKTQRRRPRRRGSALTVVGMLLLVTGLSCLGWVGYQYVGTNVVSEHAFRTERGQLRDRWSAAPRATATPAADPGQATALLRIPAFGSDYEVPILDGTSLDVLAKGVGHYVSTGQPGQAGNFALAGHRVTHGEPFARLLELNQGDQVIVETQQAVYTYVLDTAPREVTVQDTATWVLEPVPGKPAAKPTRPLITLTTCQDLFRSPDRSIGFGHLVSTRNK